MSILNQYNLKFNTTEVLGNIMYIPEFSDENIYGIMSTYMSEYSTENEVQELISDIEEVMNGIRPPFSDALDEMVECRVSPTNTEFYDVWEGVNWNQPDLVIPTVDFKDILVEWKTFLESQSE